jgi:hypothetical protein
MASLWCFFTGAVSASVKLEVGEQQRSREAEKPRAEYEHRIRGRLPEGNLSFERRWKATRRQRRIGRGAGSRTCIRNKR